MKQSKGITLVALVITIIILLILAGISIQSITNTGIFEKASQAKKEAERSQIVEWLTLKLIEEQTYNPLGTSERIIEATRQNVDDNKSELVKMGKTVTVGNTKTEEDGEQVDIYFYVQVDEDVYKVDIKGAQFIGEAGKFSPKIELVSITGTTNSITVQVTTKRNEGGKIEYYIKTEDKKEYGKPVTKTETTYTYTGLEQNKTYNIKIVAVAENGQTAEVKEDKTLGSVPDLTQGDIIFTYTVDGQEINEKAWTNKSVTVTASTDAKGYIIKTSKDKQTWENKTSQTFTENGKIYVALYDGTNYGSSASGNVTNIDTTTPSSFTIDKSEVGANSFTLSATFEDNESGLGKIIWYYKRPQDSSWQSEEKIYTQLNGTTTGTTGSVTQTYSVENMTLGGEVQAYAIAYDVAGNEITTTNATENNPLTFETIKYTITYHTTSGSGTMNAGEKYIGEDYSISSCGFSAPSGYSFAGWSTSNSSATVTYNAGNTYTADASLDLYAVWYCSGGTSKTISVCSYCKSPWTIATCYYCCSELNYGDGYGNNGESAGKCPYCGNYATHWTCATHGTDPEKQTTNYPCSHGSVSSHKKL